MNFKHIGRLLHIYWAYAINKRVRTKYPPYRLWIEPTSKCNLSCTMCPNKELPESQIGMMEIDLFKKIIDESKHYVHDISIHHRGESLLHKSLPEMIKYAKENNVKVKLHTNATLLTQKNALKILQSDLDLISFSFDGIDKKSYENIRIGANYNKTVNNIQKFLRLKQELGKKKPFTVLEMIDFTGYDTEYDLTKLSVFKKQFAGLSLNQFIVKSPHNFGGSIDLTTTSTQNVYSSCTFLWHSLVIFWNGNVSPCPQDFHGALILGNVKNNTIMEIFNGNEMLALREKAVNGGLQKLNPCTSCDMIRRRKLLGVPIKSLKYLIK